MWACGRSQIEGPCESDQVPELNQKSKFVRGPLTFRALWSRLRSSTVATAAGIYGMGNAINAAVPFLLMPYLTRVLSKEDYGIVNLFGLGIMLVLPLANFGLVGYVSVARFRQSEAAYRRVLAMVPSIIIGLSSILTLGAWVLEGPLQAILPIPLSALLMVPITAGTRSITDALLTKFQAERRPAIFCVVQFSQTLLNLILTIALVKGIGWAWQGRVYAQVGAAACGAIYSIYRLAPWQLLNSAPTRDELRRAFAFGMPLVPQIFAMSVMGASDRYLVSQFAGVAAVGVYGVGYQLGQSVSLLDLSIGRALNPWLYETLAMNEGRVRIYRSFVLYFALLAMAALFVTVLARSGADVIFGKNFSGAVPYVFWIAMSFACSGVAALFSSVCVFFEKTKWLWISTFVAGAFHVSAICLLVPRFGPIAAAVSATFAAFGRAAILAGFSFPLLKKLKA